MRNRWMISGATIIVSIAACGRSQANEELGHDLELARSQSGLAMAPTSAGTQVVSSVERMPARSPMVSRSQSVTSTRRSPKTNNVLPVASHEEAQSLPTVDTATVQAPAEVGSGGDVRPAPRPASSQREPRGGWHSVSDVIRNAPFPITP